MDCAMHKAGVTFVLDRAGVTGDDGASHHGMWDMSLLHLVPRLRLAAPRDAATLRAELAEAIAVDDGPTVLRFSKGAVPQDIPAIEQLGDGPGAVDVLRRDGEPDVLLVAVGSMVPLCLDVADRLLAQGIGVTVVDPRWVLPVPDAVAELAAGHRLVAVVEDNLVAGGVGSAVRDRLDADGVGAPVRCFGVPARFIDHATRAQVLEEIGLTPQEVGRAVVESMARLGGPDQPSDAEVRPFRPRAG
jgi:1-deoxy-D-xylulose-5-phosphate synthase